MGHPRSARIAQSTVAQQPEITEANIQNALECLRTGRSPTGNPLLTLRCVARRLDASPSSSQRGRSRETLEWALALTLWGTVESSLARLRATGNTAPARGSSTIGDTDPARSSTDSTLRGDTGSARSLNFGDQRSGKLQPADLTADTLRQIEADFWSDNAHLEAWACLYYRYLHVPALQVQDLASIARPRSPHGRRHVHRRAQLGLRLLTTALQEAESALTPDPGRRGVPTSSPPPPLPPRPSQSLIAHAMQHLTAHGSLPELAREQLYRLAALDPANPTEHHLSRIATWSGPRFRLDARFVNLSLLVDSGDQSAGGRWVIQSRRFASLGSLFDTISDPAFVVLGPPGSGKSSLLRHFEIEAAVDALRTGGNRLSFLADLSDYAPDAVGAYPHPLDWLAALWSYNGRRAALPALSELIQQGRLLLLLDGLNEIPHHNQATYREAVHRWQTFLVDIGRGGVETTPGTIPDARSATALETVHASSPATASTTMPGNRVIFTCRSLDYSAPLSSPALRVPQAQIEPLDNAQVQAFLATNAPDLHDAIWTAIHQTPMLDMLRLPFHLRLLVDQVKHRGKLPDDRAALISGFIRYALRREIEQANPLFSQTEVLAERDYWRLVQSKPWADPHALPSRGLLFPGLSNLADAMQRSGINGEAVRVRLPFDAAAAQLATPDAGTILRAASALGLIDDDAGRDEVAFAHQIFQEYFAGRRMAASRNFERLQTDWLADVVHPSAAELIQQLPRADALPPLPSSGWEETTVLAALMAADPDAFVRQLIPVNLALAGRCATERRVRRRLDPVTETALIAALIERSGDPCADLRARIDASLLLGRLGDPRLARRIGSRGDYLLPPFVQIPGGAYPIGEDDAFSSYRTPVDSQVPRHTVALTDFNIARYPVTNAEWACFMAAGGYETEDWWDTTAARAWHRGRGTREGHKASLRWMWNYFREQTSRVDEFVDSGKIDHDAGERWQRWITLDSEAFERQLADQWPDRRITEPHYFRSASYDNPSQPVVGISWFEARAYCRWLSAQTGLALRLPTEAELQAAARGQAARLYAYGDAYDPLRNNTVHTHLHRPTPIGVFPDGDTPEGLTDMAGNVYVWTSSAWGTDDDVPTFRYPYEGSDGRENPDGPPELQRIVMGGSFADGGTASRTAFRSHARADARQNDVGLRLVYREGQ